MDTLPNQIVGLENNDYGTIDRSHPTAQQDGDCSTPDDFKNHDDEVHDDEGNNVEVKMMNERLLIMMRTFIIKLRIMAKGEIMATSKTIGIMIKPRWTAAKKFQIAVIQIA